MRSTQDRRTPLILACALLFVTGPIAQAQTEPEQNESSKTGVISGRVNNESGQPLENASVFVRGSIAGTQTRVTITDSEGYFQVKNLDHGLYSVSAAAPAYVTPPRDLETATSYYRIGDSVTLSLIKGGVITGTVTSISGEPLVQIGVRATLVRDLSGRQPKEPAYQLVRTTDDRGVYRLYGLLPGTYIVSAGGSAGLNYIPAPTAYVADAPTFAPSSIRDTAAEITVRTGEESGGVDIRYRGESGHAISGIATGPPGPNPSYVVNITLTQISNGVPQTTGYSFQTPNSKGFAFYGLGDGDYDVTAQESLGGGGTMVSEPLRVTVRGADVTGIVLTTRPLGSMSGHVVLETASAPECRNKRQPLFSETLVLTRQKEKQNTQDELRQPTFFAAQGSPDKTGDFLLRNLAPGQYSLNTQFFAKYWYLQAITLQALAARATAARSSSPNRPVDVARNWVSLKRGEQLTGLTILLSEGAATLRGHLTVNETEKPPLKSVVYLVPAEKEKADDVLHFFAGAASSDGSFSFGNLPPGRYWVRIMTPGANETGDTNKLRTPDEADYRARLRLEGQLANTLIELKACQTVLDYQLPFKSSLPKNDRAAIDY